MVAGASTRTGTSRPIGPEPRSSPRRGDSSEGQGWAPLRGPLRARSFLVSFKGSFLYVERTFFAWIRTCRIRDRPGRSRNIQLISRLLSASSAMDTQKKIIFPKIYGVPAWSLFLYLTLRRANPLAQERDGRRCTSQKGCIRA